MSNIGIQYPGLKPSYQSYSAATNSGPEAPLGDISLDTSEETDLVTISPEAQAAFQDNPDPSDNPTGGHPLTPDPEPPGT